MTIYYKYRVFLLVGGVCYLTSILATKTWLFVSLFTGGSALMLFASLLSCPKCGHRMAADGPIPFPGKYMRFDPECPQCGHDLRTNYSKQAVKMGQVAEIDSSSKTKLRLTNDS